jgi:hypothetical protein
LKDGLLGAMALQRNTSLAGAGPAETARFGDLPCQNDRQIAFKMPWGIQDHECPGEPAFRRPAGHAMHAKREHDIPAMTAGSVRRRKIEALDALGGIVIAASIFFGL